MSRINVRAKGRNAEYVARDLLQEQSNIAAELCSMEPLKIERNLSQTRGGGCDLINTFGFAVEVKHHAVLALDVWWQQTVLQAKDLNKRPLLLYKHNREWRAQLITQINMNKKWFNVRSDINIEALKIIFREHCIEHYNYLKRMPK